MGNLTNYYEYVNLEIDHYTKTTNFFYTSEAPLESLFERCCSVIQKEQIDISRIPDSLQTDFLKKKRTFTDWKNGQFLCLPQSSNLAAKSILTTHQIDSKTPDADILHLLFENMYKELTGSKKDLLISYKKQVQPLYLASKGYLRATAEKIIKFIASPKFWNFVVFSVVITTFAVSCIALLVLEIKIYHILLPHLPPQLIDLLPTMEKTIISSLNYFSLLEITTRCFFPSLHPYLIKPLKRVFMWIFFPFVEISSYISIKTYYLICNHFPTSQFQSFLTKWHDLQLHYEYCEARDLWVTLCLNERTQIRAEIEYAYATYK